MKQIYEYPLKQHIGVGAVPVVVEGDAVKRGQLLAFQEETTLGANLHSSVSGQVSRITDSGIFIEADSTQEKSYLPLKGTDPLALIKEAGIVGLGGAGFPTYAKFTKPFQNGGTVIVNAAECEPILSHNIARITAYPTQLLRGLIIAMQIANAANGVVAVKACHKEAIAALTAANQNDNIRIVTLENLYPMGEERAIIREVLGKLLSVTALPSEADAIVINAETACRIKEAVDDKKPLIDKDLTVAGKISGNTQEKLIQIFLDVPIGTSVSSMFACAGGLSDSYGELIMGGPFTGKRTTLDAPVLKTTGGLIAAECFPRAPSPIGLLVCACGANEARLREIAASLGAKVCGVERCKQAAEVKGNLKCENPGRCPGQVQKILSLKKAGAKAVLISNCTDCSNTVMSCAPKLGLPVYHCTDGALRAVNEPLIRRFKANS